MSLNKFSAHTPEERERLMGFRRQEIEPVASTFDGSKAKGEVSALYQNNVSAVDWRLHGKVSSVKNQG